MCLRCGVDFGKSEVLRPGGALQTCDLMMLELHKLHKMVE